MVFPSFMVTDPDLSILISDPLVSFMVVPLSVYMEIDPSELVILVPTSVFSTFNAFFYSMLYNFV
jgi:hypothetical protein